MTLDTMPAATITRRVQSATLAVRSARELCAGCIKAGRTHWHSMLDWMRWENPERAAHQRRLAVMWMREARRWHHAMQDARDRFEEETASD